MEKHDLGELNRQRRDVPGNRGQEQPSSMHMDVRSRSERVGDAAAIIEGHRREREKRESRRKWTGRGVMLFGFLTMWSSCGLYTFSLLGLQTRALEVLILSVVLVGAGFAISAWRPRLKDTNEALLIAMKYGNRLTAARLALELDISFEKAEKIIQELVRSGIAEIDLERTDPDQPITYKISGL